MFVNISFRTSNWWLIIFFLIYSYLVVSNVIDSIHSFVHTILFNPNCTCIKATHARLCLVLNDLAYLNDNDNKEQSH